MDTFAILATAALVGLFIGLVALTVWLDDADDEEDQW